MEISSRERGNGLANALRLPHLTFLTEKTNLSGSGVGFFPAKNSITVHLKIPTSPFSHCLCIFSLSYPNTHLSFQLLPMHLFPVLPKYKHIVLGACNMN